jgi:S1-C subfamily serine protease
VVARGDLAQDEKSTIDLFRQSSPSVVHIGTAALQQDAFSFNITAIPQGMGTGFIWDVRGHVVTNYHVLAGANAARVTLVDGSSWDAALVGVAEDKDLAVLRIDAARDKLRALPVGESHNLLVGQKVFAIGNPFGYDHSMTTGIISALGRTITSVNQQPIRDVIQTDAAINPGNSGGPLLDSAGRLIGVNAMIYSPSGGSAGIGFAIPVDTVNRVVPDLIRYGKVQRAGLGIGSVPDSVAQEAGIDGVVILSVAAGSAAAKAGLRPVLQTRSGAMELGDVIVGLDGKEVHFTRDLATLLDDHKAGDTVTMAVMRDGTETKLRVTLQQID